MISFDVCHNKDYVEIQDYPKVILAQPNDALFIEYMENRGFMEIEEERLGGIRVFTNGDTNEWIMYSKILALLNGLGGKLLKTLGLLNSLFFISMRVH